MADAKALSRGSAGAMDEDTPGFLMASREAEAIDGGRRYRLARMDRFTMSPVSIDSGEVQFRGLSMRVWHILRRLLFLLPLLVFAFLFVRELSYVRATIILLAEAPVFEVRLSVDGRPAPPGMEHVEPSPMFVWHDLPTRRGSAIEIGWRRPGGERDALLQRLPHKDALECVHVIRLSRTGELLPALDRAASYEGSAWRWLNSRCDYTYDPMQ